MTFSSYAKSLNKGWEISWNDKGITRFHFLSSIQKGTKPKVSIPFWVGKIIVDVQKYFSGEWSDFSDVPIDLHSLSTFQKRIYAVTRTIPFGQVKTYREIAKEIGSPFSARAVGGALGRNPIALIIPCHRVIASNGSIGGFSASGGKKTKLKLLSIEGVKL